MDRTQEFTIKQGDTLPALVEQLFGADGAPIDLTTAVSVELQVKRVDGTYLIHDLTNGVEIVGDPVNGTIICRWTDGDSDAVGKHVQEVRVKFASGDEIQVPNDRKGYPFTVIREAVPG